MARCPDCNKFVPVESGEPEVQSVSVEDSQRDGGKETGNVNAEVRLTVVCGECSTELSEAVLTEFAQFELEHKSQDCSGELEAEEGDVEATDDYEGKGRGMKHFYGATLSVRVYCPECEAEVEVEVDFREQASSFDSLV
jgi:endogenous inhibitor of DNA gyrase (YacG/DUF329 family)